MYKSTYGNLDKVIYGCFFTELANQQFISNTRNRRNYPGVFCKKVISKHFANFTRKNL